MTRLIACLLCLFCATAVVAKDKYVGYYYPEISSEETFDRVIRRAPDANRPVRVDFVNILTASQLDAPESPKYLFFAKGDDAGTLILTALDDDVFATLYRARAVLAQLTVNVRMGGYFQQEDLQYVATFLDLLQMMEFDELIITDGKTWTHRVNFKR